MAEVVASIGGAILSKILSLSDDDNNNQFAAEIDDMKRGFAKTLEAKQIEFQESLKQNEEKFSREIQEMNQKYDQNFACIQNEINEINKKNEIFEKETKDRQDKLEKKAQKIKNEQKLYKDKVDKIERDFEQFKTITLLQNKGIYEKSKCEHDKLEKDINYNESQNSEKEKEYNQSLLNKKIESENILEEQKSLISEMRRKNQELSLENEKQKQLKEIEFKNISNNINDQIQKMNKNYLDFEEEKKLEEEKKQNEEKLQKKKDLNNKNMSEKQFKEKSKIKFNQFIEKLKNKIIENNFFDEIFNEYDTKEISTIIQEIISEIDLKQVFDEKTKNFLNLVETIKINPDMNHLNILLLGPTGSGKSTLINVLLELEGEERAEVGDDNNPKTMDFHAYTSNKKKYIRCYDSRGIEKNKDYSLDEFIKNSKNLILKKLQENNPDEFIHIILYCFDGDRFVNEVRDSLYKLMDLYNDDTLPIILVHTRGVQGENEELFDIIAKTLKKENRKIDLIDICAEKDDDFPAFGIDELYKLMVSKVRESVKSACFSSVQNKIRDNFIKVNVDYKNSFKEEFKKIINKELKDIKLNSNINEQKRIYLKIFSHHIFEKILFDNKKKLNENNKNILNNYLNNFFKWILEKSEEYMINFISENSFELISDLLSIQHSINSKYDNKLQIQKNNEEWKDEIDKKLKKELDNVILFNLMKEGSIFIYDEFNKMLLDMLEKEYKEYLQKDNEFITNVTKGKVEEILNRFVFN